MNNISWWRTSFGDREVDKLRESVYNEHISAGPVTRQFEEDFASQLDVPYAVATTSGSAALYIALTALGIGQGDEVIVPDRTWIATAHAVMLAGGEVVLSDVLPDIPIMGIEQIEAKITPKTKAIIPVHIYGQPVRIDEIKNKYSKMNTIIVENPSNVYNAINNRHDLKEVTFTVIRDRKELSDTTINISYKNWTKDINIIR